MRHFRLTVLTVSLLAVSSCSSDGDSSDSASPPAGAEAGSVEESSEGGGDTVEVPSDFAIPTVDGAVLVIDSLPGIPDGTYLQLLYPGDRYDELVRFYETWIGEQSVEWSPTPPDTSEGTIWFSLSLEGEPGYGQSITIAGPTDRDNRAAVSLVAESVDI